MVQPTMKGICRGDRLCPFQARGETGKHAANRDFATQAAAGRARLRIDIDLWFWRKSWLPIPDVAALSVTQEDHLCRTLSWNRYRG